MKVVPLETRAVEVQQDVVAILKDALAEAEAGEVKGLGIVLVMEDDTIRSRSAKMDCLHQLVAGAAYLQHDLISVSGQ